MAPSSVIFNQVSPVAPIGPESDITPLVVNLASSVTGVTHKKE